MVLIKPPGGSSSKSGAKSPLFDPLQTSRIIQQLQGQIRPSELEQQGIGALNTLRSDVGSLFENLSRGISENVPAGFNKALSGATQKLSDRGASETALALLGDAGAGRESSIVQGVLQDNLGLDRIGALSGITNSLVELLMGSSANQSALLKSLLENLPEKISSSSTTEAR